MRARLHMSKIICNFAADLDCVSMCLRVRTENVSVCLRERNEEQTINYDTKMMKNKVFLTLMVMMGLLFASCEPTSENYPSQKGTLISLDGEWNWSYDGESHTLTLTGTGEMAAKDNVYPWLDESAIFRRAIQHVVIGKGFTLIGAGIFDGCISIRDITIPDGITVIGEKAFKDCQSLKSLKIPNTVTIIGQKAFSGCVALESAQLSEKLTTINPRLFEYCHKLSSLIIPASVSEIGYEFVCYCEALKTIVCKPTTPPTITSSTFDNSSVKTVKVPASSVDAYKNAESWKLVIRDKNITIEAE